MFMLNKIFESESESEAKHAFIVECLVDLTYNFFVHNSVAITLQQSSKYFTTHTLWALADIFVGGGP